MASIFVTGSSDGLGRMAAALLVEQGHRVVLHARSEARGRDAIAAVPGAAAVLCADLSSLMQTKRLAAEANEVGAFDAVIHNAAVGYREKHRVITEDGLSHVFAVNTLAPFILTALMHRPKRLIYVSSELHRRGAAVTNDLNWESRAWNGTAAYSDTKLHDAMLAFAIARCWPDVRSNALEPGWVATKMGGPRATGDLRQGHLTQSGWRSAPTLRHGAQADTSSIVVPRRRAAPRAMLAGRMRLSPPASVSAACRCLDEAPTAATARQFERCRPRFAKLALVCRLRKLARWRRTARRSL